MGRTRTFFSYTYLTIGVTFIISLLFYGVYVKISPLTNYAQIKAIIDNTANFSAADRNLIGSYTITNSMVDKVVEYFIPNLIQYLVTSLIIGSFIILVFYVMNKPPGRPIVFYVMSRTSTDTKDTIAAAARNNDDKPIPMPDKKIDFFKDFNNMVLTVDGILISIIGGFTVASGSKNLVIINGFEVLIISVVYSFLAHTALTNGLTANANEILKSSFLRYASRSNFSFWFFILGLSLIVGGFVLYVL